MFLLCFMASYSCVFSTQLRSTTAIFRHKRKAIMWLPLLTFLLKISKEEHRNVFINPSDLNISWIEDWFWLGLYNHSKLVQSLHNLSKLERENPAEVIEVWFRNGWSSQPTTAFSLYSIHFTWFILALLKNHRKAKGWRRNL